MTSIEPTRTCGETRVLCTNTSGPLRRQVFLVPGFFGFSSLGEQLYFTDVAPLLCTPGTRVTSTDTDVTTSLHLRARKLARIVAAHMLPETEVVHFVGHSSGGLDLRLLLSPDGEALDELEFEDGSHWHEGVDPGGSSHAARLRQALDLTSSVTCLATPHGGTPLADIGLRLGVDHLLSFAGEWLTDNTGLASAGLAGVTDILRRLPLAPSSFTNLRALQDGLLHASATQVVTFLAEFGLGTGLLEDLTTDARQRPCAELTDRPGVRYFDVVTGVAQPCPPRGEGLTLMTAPLFRALWRLAGQGAPRQRWSPETVAQLRARRERDRGIGARLGHLALPDVDVEDRVLPNDGIIPTYSQVHGELLMVVAADHLDPIGFYRHCIGQLDTPAGHECPPEHRQATSWVVSGSGYDNTRHRLLWTRVREAMVAAEYGDPAP